MSESFGPDFITVTDEDGNEMELEYLDTLEYKGQTYLASFQLWKRGPMRTAMITASSF